MTMLKSTAVLLLGAALALMVASTSALAVDGMVEINQAKVNKAGGFPFAITNPGSYRLTGNLSVPDGADGIDVNVPNVTLDLNGFSIVGVPCFGSTGSRVGVSSTQDKVTVQNGTVTRMGSDGIKLTGLGVTVTNVKSVQNCGNGINCSGSSGSIACRVSASTFTSNSGDGMKVGSTALVIGNISYLNTRLGLECDSPTSGYSNNVFDSNGIQPVSGCTSMGNNLCGASLCP
jgi:hypothetical protein